MPFGSEANGSHLRPRRSGTITATGIPIDRGRGSHVWEIKIYDEDEKLVSISRCTLNLVEIRRIRINEKRRTLPPACRARGL
jgi:1,4-dihydroxy-2-naphthoyl-CoA hydrolase